MVKDLRTGYQEPNPFTVLDGQIDEFMYKVLVTNASGKGLSETITDLE